MTQLSNTPMQPKPTDAVERPLTLIEKLRNRRNEISEVFFYKADFDDIATQLGFTDEEKEVDNDDWLDEILSEKRLSGYLCKLQMQMRNSRGATWN